MYVDLEKGGEDIKLQLAIDMIKEENFTLYQINTILQKFHDEIIFGDCCDGIDKMDDTILWNDYQIAINTLETAILQLNKVAYKMMINNRKGKQNGTERA